MIPSVHRCSLKDESIHVFRKCTGFACAEIRAMPATVVVGLSGWSNCLAADWLPQKVWRVVGDSLSCVIDDAYEYDGDLLIHCDLVSAWGMPMDEGIAKVVGPTVWTLWGSAARRA